MFIRLMTAGLALLLMTGSAAAAGPVRTGHPALVAAQTPTPASSEPTPPLASVVSGATAAGGAPALTSQDLRSFFDALVPYMLKRNDIAGGVIAVVKDGHLIF
ncbi:MAG: hypothetical protein ACREPU_04185, partial [Rhodanobacteraceae bacterium]